MLVLARRLHERIVIPSILTTVEVTAVKPGFARLGIEAPPEVTVLREEVYRRGTAKDQGPEQPSATGAPARWALASRAWRPRLNNLTRGLGLLRLQLPPGTSAEALATLCQLEGEAEDLYVQLRTLCEGNPTAAAAVDEDRAPSAALAAQP